MAVFSILSEIPQPQLRARIESLYAGRYYQFSESVWFLRDNGPAKAIATNLGIRTKSTEGNLVGDIEQAAVIQTSPSYWGWTSAALWDWLKASFEASD
jgi:hypothetical protein